MGNAWAGTPVLQTKNGAVVHWGKPIVDVGFDPLKTSRWIPLAGIRQAITDAIATWNAVQAGQPQLYLVEQGPFDITLRFCRTRWRGSHIDLGLSEFTADPETGLLESSMVEINECDQSFFAPGEAPNGRHALAGVLMHEFGHTLGLGHSKNASSVMFPTGGGVTRRELQTDDMEAIAAIYLGRFSVRPTTVPAKPDPSRVPVSLEKQAQRALPGNATPLLRIKAHNGRSLVVFTSEPTLLPPLMTSPPERPGKLRQSKAKR